MTIMTNMVDPAGVLPRKVTTVPKDVILTFKHSKKVGHYLLGKTIGEGSFAKVKEAMHILTGEKVAIKIVSKGKIKEDSYIRKNLRREGKLLQLIRHPNIVKLLDIMETENSYYLVMEYCKGGDLMEYICQKQRLEEKEVKRLIRQVISAVDYLHRMGILHRDLKVENLLLDENKDIKIIDFGLSNKIKMTTTKDGMKVQEYLLTQCGSPAYAAPELLGKKKYGPQVDVWSIGVNMFAMLTGNLPFTVQPFNIKVLHNKMIAGQMNPVSEVISRDCRDLIRKFLIPDPDNRITLTEAMKHPWIDDCNTKPLERSIFPNKRTSGDLDERILKQMSECQGFRLGDIVRCVTGNIPSPALATYYGFEQKLKRYIFEIGVKENMSAIGSYSQRSMKAYYKHQVINKSVPSSPLLTIPKMKGQMESQMKGQMESQMKGQMEGKRRRDRYCSVDTKNQENCTLMDIDENDSNLDVPLQSANQNKNETNMEKETLSTVKSEHTDKRPLSTLTTTFPVVERTVTNNGAMFQLPETNKCESLEKPRRNSVPKSLLLPKTSRRVIQKAQTEHNRFPPNVHSTYTGTVCKTHMTVDKKARTISTDGCRNINGRFIRKAEVKIINNKKRIDLIYTTTDNSPHGHLDSRSTGSHLDRRSPGSHLDSRSPGSHLECRTPENHLECRSPTENCKKPTIEQNKLFLRSKLQNGDLKCIQSKEQPKDITIVEETNI